MEFNNMGLPQWLSNKRICLQCRRCLFDPWVRKIPWKMTWQPTPVFLPRESHGQRSLVGYHPQGHKESDTTEATEHSGTAKLHMNLFFDQTTQFLRIWSEYALQQYKNIYAQECSLCSNFNKKYWEQSEWTKQETLNKLWTIYTVECYSITLLVFKKSRHLFCDKQIDAYLP